MVTDSVIKSFDLVILVLSVHFPFCFEFAFGAQHITFRDITENENIKNMNYL